MLFRSCLAIDSSLRTVVDAVAPLTDYAWKFRYPGDSQDPPEEEAQDALAVARAACASVTERLPPQVHS